MHQCFATNVPHALNPDDLPRYKSCSQTVAISVKPRSALLYRLIGIFCYFFFQHVLFRYFSSLCTHSKTKNSLYRQPFNYNLPAESCHVENNQQNSVEDISCSSRLASASTLWTAVLSG